MARYFNLKKEIKKLYLKFNFSIIITLRFFYFYETNLFLFLFPWPAIVVRSPSFFSSRFNLLPRFSLSGAIKKRGGTTVTRWRGGRGVESGCGRTPSPLPITATAGSPPGNSRWMIQIHPGYPVKKIILSRLQTNLLFNRDQDSFRVKFPVVKWKIRGKVIIGCKKGGKTSKKYDKV